MAKEPTATEIVDTTRAAIEADKPSVAPPVIVPPPFKVEVKNRVTVPLSKWVYDVPKYVKFEGAIFRGKEMKNTQNGAKMEPADLAFVVDLVTKMHVQIIVATVLRVNLKEAYPQDGYIGKCFMLVQKPKAANKRYSEYEITEIVEPK